MSWSASSSSSWPSTVREGIGMVQIEHELVARQHRLVSVGGERPLRVSAVQVAVRVDHLRLDPDAELHAQAAHVIDQRAEAGRVRIGRHDPVAEAGRVVAARAEPPVVEHEPLGTHPCCSVGELGQARQVVVEVDRLHVFTSTGRGVDGWVARARRWRWNCCVAAVRPWSLCTATTSGGAVRLAGEQRQLAGVQQLAELQVAAPVGEPLGEDRVVAAPGQVCAPHRSAPLGVARRAREHERRVLVGGSAAPVLHRVRAVLPGAADGVQLAGPAARERAELASVLRHRERDREPVEEVAVVSGVRDLGPHHERLVELEHDGECQPGDDVARIHRCSAARHLVAGRDEQRRPRRAPAPVPGESGTPGDPAACSGTTETGATTSAEPPTIGRSNTTGDAATGVPQCTIVGTPDAMSTTRSLERPRRWIMGRSVPRDGMGQTNSVTARP